MYFWRLISSPLGLNPRSLISTNLIFPPCILVWNGMGGHNVALHTNKTFFLVGIWCPRLGHELLLVDEVLRYLRLERRRAEISDVAPRYPRHPQRPGVSTRIRAVGERLTGSGECHIWKHTSGAARAEKFIMPSLGRASLAGRGVPRGLGGGSAKNMCAEPKFQEVLKKNVGCRLLHNILPLVPQPCRLCLLAA